MKQKSWRQRTSSFSSSRVAVAVAALRLFLALRFQKDEQRNWRETTNHVSMVLATVLAQQCRTDTGSSNRMV